MKNQRKQFCKPYFKLKLAHIPESQQAPFSIPQLCAAYQWPSGQTGGGVVAIVELDGGWIKEDMVSFFNSIGQPLPKITNVSVDGTKNSPNKHLVDLLPAVNGEDSYCA